jgi:imidazolonepropionase-like amidohydrolase
MIKRFVIAVVLITVCSPLLDSQTSPTIGLRDNDPSVHALINARIVVNPGTSIERGTVVIRNGLIEAVGAQVVPPADARVWDMSGKTLYAGFIDLYTDIGIPDPEADRGGGNLDALLRQVPAQFRSFLASQLASEESPGGSEHWNPQVRSYLDGATVFKPDTQQASIMRSQGFTNALAAPADGIFRGRSVLVSLGEGNGNDLILRDNVTHNISFDRSRRLGGGYPTSLMGSIALIRQTLSDADWYIRAHEAYRRNPAGTQRPEMNIALASLADAVRGRQPVIVETSDELALLRAAKIGEEFSLAVWIRGSGHEYKRVDAVNSTNLPVILPVNFPAPPDVSTPETARDVSLEELLHWHNAPSNPARLSRHGVRFAFTSDQLEDKRTFLAQIRKAVENGLTEEAALSALTTTPAELLGMSEKLGTIERGKIANIVVADGSLFYPDTKIMDLWVDGHRFEIESVPDTDVRGTWYVSAVDIGLEGVMNIEGNSARLTGTITIDDKGIELKPVRFNRRRLSVAFQGDTIDIDGRVLMSSTVSREEMYGTGTLPDGYPFAWRAERREEYAPSESERSSRKFEPLNLPTVYPAMEYGIEQKPEQPQHVLIRNATLWTQGPNGILEGADMLITRGTITRIGKDISPPRNAVVIDGEGKHVTPGLIDAHIHTSIEGGVNEVGNAITAEVNIRDVLNSNNLWIYRLLAGGLTTANALHGSANPIGGQNAIIKMRWGSLPDEMLIEDAPKGIKFALGENVTRNQRRYPNTRMGVEQIIRDEFQAAREYERTRNRWEQTGSGIPPRRDYRLETVLEILKGERHVHSHCYRQDEILALIRVAEDFGFTIQSFQHTVEGFKIAEALREHGASAAVWSDWWAFKVEAYDATTYNARLLHDQGVLTVIHSDNTQLATRMNWEAAKVVQTGVTEEDALSMITINPAKMLGIDHRVGSLEEEKDADFVLWDRHPLATDTRVEQTWIDGRKFFDRDDDVQKRDEVRELRAQLIQSALVALDDEEQPRRRGPRRGISPLNEDYSCTEENHELR